MKNIYIYFSKPSQHLFYLSILRLFICFHLAKDVIFHWSLTNLLYKPESFFVPGLDGLFYFLGINQDWLRVHFDIIFIIYQILILLYALGIGKYITAIFLYAVFEIIQRLNANILNGGDNYLKFIILYMVFCNSYQYFSLTKIRQRNPFWSFASNLITNISIFNLKLHLCLIYFISGLAKAHSDVWYNGIANYYILQVERFQGTSINKILARNGFFVTISTYFTLVWELFFPILVWIKKLRIPLLLMGILLHIMIYIFLMIYDFEIIFIVVYGIFFTDEELFQFYNNIKTYFKLYAKRLHLRNG
ncbi:MAG TPA: HTTM domain-containing protein [Chitinophaga sp.]|uniref:HTTM domain-containing protein n=1 Tax=Chitinophaga sp. TaxID=1869181 RepID=UPI002C0A1BEC|nr:HTTM domain-containing protein [Chitinophaga sp.]HVI46462.1 HTTM domain-containing protein [Chitinophaga sp.]